MTGEPHHDLPWPEYAYLLGLYLGDGHLARHRRGVYRLRISLDAKYPSIVCQTGEAMEAVLPGKQAYVQLVTGTRCLVVSTYSKRWPALLPQHGPGLKHEREITLTPWQQVIVDAQPEAFLRGLVHSDGCRGTNRVVAGGRTYEYARYQFTNRSDDIKRLFCASCDRLGVEWRVMNAKTISVARRSSVARLDAFIGPKR